MFDFSAYFDDDDIISCSLIIPKKVIFMKIQI